MLDCSQFLETLSIKLDLLFPRVSRTDPDAFFEPMGDVHDVSVRPNSLCCFHAKSFMNTPFGIRKPLRSLIC